MADAEDVRRIALSFPATSERNSGFGVNDKGFAWFYQEKIEGQRGRVERLDVFAVRVADLGEKEALLAADPEKFFTTPHYNGYPAVLVRLHAINVEELTDLLDDAWHLRAPKKLAAEFDARIKDEQTPE